jgi:hypothetical protein
MSGKIQKHILTAQGPAIAPQVNVFTRFRCNDSTIQRFTHHVIDSAPVSGASPELGRIHDR